MSWKFLNEARRVVERENPDGSQDSRSVEDAEIKAWLSAGGIPEAPPVPEPKPEPEAPTGVKTF